MSFLEPITVMGVPVLDMRGLLELVVRFALNILAVGSIVRFFYYPKSQQIGRASCRERV